MKTKNNERAGDAVGLRPPAGPGRGSEGREAKMPHPRLAFAVHLPEMVNHYDSIIDHLPHPPDFIISRPPSDSIGAEIAAMAEKKGCPVVWAAEPPDGLEPYDAVISNHLYVFDDPRRLLDLGRRHIRLMYSLGDFSWMFADWNVHYDAALCYGPYQQRIFAALFPEVKTAAVGYTRLDAAKGEISGRRETILGLGGDPDKKMLLWLPTVGELCSLDCYGEQLAGLNQACNVLVKPHPLTQAPATIERLKALGFKVLEDPALNNARLIKMSDFVLADYGGSLFAAILLDKDTVLLNMTGDMFMDYAGPLSPEIHMRDHFVNIEPGRGDRLPLILEDQTLWRDQKEIRRIYREHLFADIAVGEAGQQAASAIMRLAAEPPVSPKAAAPAGQLNPDLARIIPPGLLPKRFERSWWPTALWGGDKVAGLKEEVKRLRAESDSLRAEIDQLKKEIFQLRHLGIFKFARRRIRLFFKEISRPQS
jgi:hypothetical protein